MKILCIIPSRIHSTRLPRKPLLPIQGKPMVQWTYENAKRCAALADVIVATDSMEVAEIITKIGGKAELTDPALPTGSERVAAVAERYPDTDVVINLQGDEPFIQPRMLEQLISPYLSGEMPDMTTLAYPLEKDKYHEPGSVKVITDLHHNAIYFSRSPIPYYRTDHHAPVYNHMGVYAFRRDFLMQYRTLPQTPLEKTESLEQLRVLEHGYKIRVCLTEDKTLEINTPEEYALAQHFEYKHQ
ncbi:3-deoxy-manno-octulosonate cytidylyltransferase [Aquicella lusitana]|uniref:3-deoxy-manno-octulosonate cytidylyltransferase n=1 Tax=Aquicella lusitana TaxID=254246 RepID=A0A370GLC7_9COXI|nr:3-deoxy-manno-octulosonate cytidylyltransferase [Aquicella lusitana]RDI44572.1 3-deoxy-manno-octulosonate cytidylyltransferase (CMP-KDO synthetase) [Aquicella lusitana]VVC72486.1 3-deoxy-manno-octulosonate cytidylyltransferase [Aquicella lusitana]